MLREASAADTVTVGEPLFRCPQLGRMIVTRDRRHDVFARRRAFDRAMTLLVASPGGDALATVSVGIRELMVDGVAVTGAYVFDLAVIGSARRQGLARRLLAEAEAWARRQSALFMYAHVLGGNIASIAAFGHAGYRPAAAITGRIFPIFRDRSSPLGLARSARDWTATDWARAAELLRDELARHDLVPLLDGPGLRQAWEERPASHADDVWITDRAVLGLWDHRGIGYPVPLRLSPEVRALGVAARLAVRLGLPFPAPPRVGAPVATGLFLGGAGEPGDLQQLLQAAIARARIRRLDVLAAFHDRRARPRWLRGAFNVTEAYHLLVKSLLSGPAERIGRRPVWVDPLEL